tara:strand:- start:63780 stop:64937 length:1158 start_codon:yes stop_codon:yes gene_type:complete
MRLSLPLYWALTCLVLAACKEMEEQVTQSTYVPFPPVAVPELSPKDLKLLKRDDFVRIEPGLFRMGSPDDEEGRMADEKIHTVTITKPYYIAKYEVTIELWNKLLPPLLKRDEKFYLTEEVERSFIRLRDIEKKAKSTPKSLQLDPTKGEFTIESLEEILSIFEKRLAQQKADAEKKKEVSWPPKEMDAALKQFKKFLRRRQNLPITFVSYPQAKSFCWRLTELAWRESSIPREMIYRLPTEAEWEYACRAGLTGVSGLEDGYQLSGINANVDGSKREDIIGKVQYLIAKKKLVHGNREKMIYPANAWGIFDMHGNVFEWCHDFYGPYPDQSTDPTGPIRGKKRVRRGGSFVRSAHQSRSASRHSVEPSWRGSETGFRLVIGYPL